MSSKHVHSSGWRCTPGFSSGLDTSLDVTTCWAGESGREERGAEREQQRERGWRRGEGEGRAGCGEMPRAHSTKQPRPPFQRLYIPASVCCQCSRKPVCYFHLWHSRFLHCTHTNVNSFFFFFFLRSVKLPAVRKHSSLMSCRCTFAWREHRRQIWALEVRHMKCVRVCMYRMVRIRTLVPRPTFRHTLNSSTEHTPPTGVCIRGPSNKVCSVWVTCYGAKLKRTSCTCTCTTLCTLWWCGTVSTRRKGHC